MKKIIKRISIMLLAIILIITAMPISSAAVTWITLKKADGYLYHGEYKTYRFEIPVESDIRIKFGDDSYGYYKLKIRDANNNEVYSKTGYSCYKETKHFLTLKKGSYRLTIKENDDFEFEYSLLLSFRPLKPIATKSVKLNKSSLSLQKGKNSSLKATVNPTYADAVIWSSDNTKIAKVDKSGKVTGVALGKATIKAKSGSKSATCKVTVNSMSVSMLIKKTKNLRSYVENIKNYKSGKWSTSKSSVATVNSSGVVTGKSSGSCVITFTAKDNTKYKFNLSVKKPVTAKVTSVIEDSIYNDVNVYVTNNTNKDITYITLTITQYDNRGYKLKSPYDYYYYNDTLPANSGVSMTFWVNEDTKSASVHIKKVWFADGSTWTP
ncbi:MAG: Ig-like domain-containing protein [Acutalibacteraceae bacterium]